LDDDRSREKILLVMVLAVLLFLVVIFLRLLVQAKDSHGADIFRMFTLILLGVVAVCVYEFVQLSSTNIR
jgi:protein-S-isoprenylcysteine O-methyltransferase Ste14